MIRPNPARPRRHVFVIRVFGVDLFESAAQAGHAAFCQGALSVYQYLFPFKNPSSPFFLSAFKFFI